jgi:predicted  nucleic acid-binding Zn-ribbon protein
MMAAERSDEMSEIQAGMQELHRIHTDIQRVRTELERGPRQVRAKKRLVENKQAEIDQMRQKLTQSRKSADEKGLQLKSNEAKLHGLQVKLNQATSNREFEAVKGQMDADKMANSVLEDEILEALDKVDALKEGIETAEKEKAELEAEANKFADQVAAVEGDRKTELARLEASLSSAEKIIPAGLMGDYRRLVQAQGASALAPVENKACTSCMTTVTTQQGIELKTGKFIFCRSCGRMLYQAE